MKSPRSGPCIPVLLALFGMPTLPGVFVASDSRAEQPGNQRTPRRDTPARPDRGRGLLAEMTAFKTDVPAHPFTIVLVRPTRESITASVMTTSDAEGWIEFGRHGDVHLEHTSTQPLPAGQPVNFVLGNLRADEAYVYRLRYRVRPSAAAPAERDAPSAEASELYRFRTPREAGQGDAGGFTFTVQADSHLDANASPAVYLDTLTSALADKPDFHVDLGDTFMTDKRGRDFKDALPQYVAQRFYLGQVCHSAPLFMVLGNHDGEVGYASGGPESMAAWSFAQRTKYFPAPEIPNGPGMYSGRTSSRDGQGANYYAFMWGDAQFIVLDPFSLTTTRPRGGGGGPGRDQPAADVAGTDDNWSRTLGQDQYDWLTRTLEASNARYRFVLIHHLVGGLGKANRGGVESSVFFEWGGQNADGSPGFAAHRPGWAMPIHDLLVKHHVSAVLFGHDHLYVRSERDGVVYQCVPQPGNAAGGTRSAPEYGYRSGVIFASPGYLRVHVGAEHARVEYVRLAAAVAQSPDSRPGEPPYADDHTTVVHRYDLAPATAHER